MRINKRIILSFTALGTTVSIVSLLALAPIRSSLISAGNVQTAALHEIQAIEAGVKGAVEESFAYVVSGEEVEKEEFLLWVDGFDEHLQRFVEMAQVAAPGDEREKVLLERIMQKQPRLVERALVMFSEYEATGSVSQTTFAAYEASIDSVVPDIEEWTKIERAEVNEAHEQAIATLQYAGWYLGAIGLGTLLATIVVGSIVARSITWPLSRLNIIADEVGAGNLDCHANLKTHDELGQLGGAFDAMTMSLQTAQNELVVANESLRREISDRTQIEKRETQLGRIVEESLDEIFIFDVKTFRFLEVNRGARENLGYSMQEFSAMTPLDVKPQVTLEQFMEIAAPLLNGERKGVDFETVHRRKDGSLYNVEAHLQLAELDNKPVFVASIRDITSKWEAEHSLRVSEQRFRTLVEHAPEAIVVHDVDLNRFVDVNQNAIDLFKLDRESLHNIGLMEISAATQSNERPASELAQEFTEQALAGEVPVFEWTFLDAEGNEIPAEVRLVRLPSADRKLVRGSITDITARKRAEEEAHANHRLLEALRNTHLEVISNVNSREIFEGLLDTVLSLTRSEYGFIGEILHGDQDEPYLKVRAITNIAWNEETQRLYDENAETGMEFHNLKTLFGAVMTTAQPVIANDPANDTRQGGLPPGHPPLDAFLGLPVVSHGKLVGMVGVGNRKGGYNDQLVKYLQPFLTTLSTIIGAQTIEQSRQQAEAALLESEQRYRTLVDHAPEAIVVHDVQTGLFVDCNPQAVAMLKYDRDTLLTMSPETISSQPDGNSTELLKEYTAHALQGETPVFEWTLLDAEGNEIPAEVRLVRLPSADRKLVRGSITDITARKRAEEALWDSNQYLEQTLAKLKETQEQVIQQERLRALGQMAGGVAHELNNTLSPVLAYTEIVLLDPNLSTEMRQHLEYVQIAARDTANVVARLRTFYESGNKDVEYEDVRLDELLMQIVELTRPKWKDEAQRTGHSIEVVLKLEDEITVLGISTELREVFTNLIFNAVDAIPADGRITLGLHHVAEFAVVEIVDTGRGMSKDVAAHCCEPFFSTKATEGTGLGLSICHGIIERHRGHIEIVSQPGHGTTFRIFLPLALQTDRAEPHQDEKGSLPTHRVLYIDDNPKVRDSISALLKTLGQQVDVADGGAAGIEMFRSNDYDVVITDLGMPGIDGCEVTRSIKSIRGNVPVIIVTGWGSSDKLLRIDPSVAPDQVLSKPLTMAQLMDVLENVSPSRNRRAAARL